MRKLLFGLFIAESRQAVKLSQRAFADTLNIHHTYISKIENAKIDVMPSHDLLIRMANTLGVTHEAMLDKAGYYDPAKLDAALEKHPKLASLIRAIYETEDKQQP